MRRWIATKVTFANVTAMLALVVALSGTAYAADIARNSVGSPQVINNSLKGADVKEGSLGRVPDAARLNGVAATSYDRSGGTATGAFDGSLEVDVAGYGSFGLSCDDADEVHFTGYPGPLGTGAKEYISMDWTDGPYTQAGTSTQLFTWTGGGGGTSVDGGARFHFRALVQNAAGTKHLVVEGWGTQVAAGGCSGHVETWILA
jgi:hypothetical protein